MATQLQNLIDLVEQSPDDPLVLYGLAMEYRKVGQLEAAADLFGTLQERFPDYVPQYLMHGQLLEAMGTPDAARETYRLGIEKAQAQGETHAQSELEEALERVTT